MQKSQGCYGLCCVDRAVSLVLVVASGRRKIYAFSGVSISGRRVDFIAMPWQHGMGVALLM